MEWGWHEVPEKPVDCIIADLRGENESLRGALQAALLALEAMTDALVPPARVEEARGHLEDALVALREELE